MNGEELNFLLVSQAPNDPDGDCLWSGKAMMVAGGRFSEYRCTVHDGDRSERVGMRPTAIRSYATVPMVIGEETDVWQHEIIDLDEAREALRIFVERGKLGRHLIWESKA